MDIKQRNLYELKPYDFNNRRHPEKQVERIGRSIKEFGFTQPIVVDGNNEIIAGHGRYYAALHLGLTDAPCVQLSDLSEKQVRAYRILDNKLQNDSSWDFDNLNLELDWLEDNEWDLPTWGLDELRFDDGEEPEVKEDDFEETEQTEIYIKLGDLIELGRHRVLCGDSTSEDDMANLAQGSKIPLLLTDPPYGVSLSAKRTGLNRITGKKEVEKFTAIKSDGDAEIYSRFLPTALSVLSDDWAGFMFYAAGRCEIEVITAIKENGIRLGQPMIWVKDNAVPSYFKYGNKFEAFYFIGPSSNVKPNGRWFGDSCAVNVMDIKRDGNNLHPSMKPIGLMGMLISDMTKAKDLVLDPFLGSGTTLIACEQLNRTCYGIEIEPKYCQVIIDRYRKYCADNNKTCEVKINGEEWPESS